MSETERVSYRVTYERWDRPGERIILLPGTFIPELAAKRFETARNMRSVRTATIEARTVGPWTVTQTYASEDDPMRECRVSSDPPESPSEASDGSVDAT